MKNLKERMRCVGVKFIKLIYNISFSCLWNRIFNRLNLSKVLVIFVVGFVTRVLINYVYDINVFVDYLNTISLTYYGMMSIFVVLVNELFSYVDLKSLPLISIKEVFSISSIRKGFSVIISNLGNKGKVPLSSGNGDVFSGKVLDKSDKVKVTGVLLMGERDAISSGVKVKGNGMLGVKGVGVKDKISDNGSGISSNSKNVPFVLGNECVDDVFGGNNMKSNSRSNHEFKRRKVTSSQYSGKYSIHSDASIDPRIPRWGPGAPKISGLSTPETMSPLFPLSEVNSPRPSQTSFSSGQVKELYIRGKQTDIIGDSYVKSPRPSYKSFTTEEFRDVVIRGIQKDIKGSIEEKVKLIPDSINEDKGFSKPSRSLSDPLKTSPKKDFSKPNRSYSDPLKTSPRKSLSDSIKTSPKKVLSKLKDYVDGPGYVEPVSPTRYKVERTSAGVKGLYGLEQPWSKKVSSDFKFSKKGIL